jgi:hypothetical protein
MQASVIAKFFSWLTLLLFISSISAVQANTFNVSSAHITKIGNGHVLNASINYPLSPRVIEALDNGIPIVFFQEFELMDSTALLGQYWTWEQTLWTTKIRYELGFHALAEQYILSDMATGKQRHFPSIEGALHSLGKIQNFTLPPEYLTETNHLILRLRSGIDLYALPTPMRPGALISSKWHLNSPWAPAQWH